ncbi:MAG TPA: hypothetical protein VJ302_20980, partial [Blastocatellia bacterium]|nr:hypothetical protein [Blastocatellia bacterium]
MMITLKAEAIWFYFEGLLMVTYDRENKRFQAGVLNAPHHKLEIHYFDRRAGDQDWGRGQKKEYDRKGLAPFDHGNITVTGGGAPAQVSSIPIPEGEIWLPFEVIPDLETEILKYPVEIELEALRPVINLNGTEFYSVLNPSPLPPGHPRNQKQPSPGKTDHPDFQPTFRPNYKRLQDVRNDPHHGPIENIRDLERVLQGPIPNLAVRAYTAATVISLSHSQKLIMELTGESGTQRLIEVAHDSNYEAKIVLNNNIDHSMTASKDHDGPTPP